MVLAEESNGNDRTPDCLRRWEDRRYDRCKWMADTSLEICHYDQDLPEEPVFNVLATMIEGRKRAMAPL